MPKLTPARALKIAIAPVLVVTLAGCGGSASGDQQAASALKSSASRYQQMVSFSQCMRSHGIAGFPDPVRRAGGGVGLEISGSKGGALNPGSPAFASAQNACKHLLPNGGAPKGAMSAADKQRFLRYSECIRTHGVPNFPDPTFSGGGAQLRLGGPGMDPSSPAFQAAQKACQSLLPFAKPGGGGSVSTAKGGGEGAGMAIQAGP